MVGAGQLIVLDLQQMVLVVDVGARAKPVRALRVVQLPGPNQVPAVAPVVLAQAVFARVSPPRSHALHPLVRHNDLLVRVHKTYPARGTQLGLR
ncbi:MAG: hypothetical protein EOO56_15540 [Hymenobacter sp.]|nr:MAG: hypothetical protein EOO56_15540 [Hymenobacter sp.]